MKRTAAGRPLQVFRYFPARYPVLIKVEIYRFLIVTSTIQIYVQEIHTYVHLTLGNKSWKLEVNTIFPI